MSDINDYKARKNDQYTPNMIADELRMRVDTARDVVLVVRNDDDSFETLVTNSDGIINAGLLEVAKVSMFDDEYEEY